jgi:hypothetical protein
MASMSKRHNRSMLVKGTDAREEEFWTRPPIHTCWCFIGNCCWATFVEQRHFLSQQSLIDMAAQSGLVVPCLVDEPSGLCKLDDIHWGTGCGISADEEKINFSVRALGVHGPSLAGMRDIFSQILLQNRCISHRACPSILGRLP